MEEEFYADEQERRRLQMWILDDKFSQEQVKLEKAENQKVILDKMIAQMQDNIKAANEALKLKHQEFQ